MAKKKRTTRKKTGKKTRKKVNVKNRLNTKNKIRLVINKLLLFLALSLVSFVLYRYVENDFFRDLFFMIAMIFSFIVVGFLIVLLVLFIIRGIRKR